MSDNEPQHTRRLDNADEPSLMPSDALDHRGDEVAPWVIELRIVGTPSVIQAHVNGTLLIGRRDPKSNTFPEVDLEKYGGYASGVSRRHAVIYQHQNRLMIRDLGSANGTILNDYKLEESKGYRLQHGDTISAGRMRMQLFFAVMPSQKDIDKSHPTQPVNFEIPQIGAGFHVLIVDPDVNVASVLKSVLEQAGFRVSIAESFREALTVIDQDMPQLILTELMLPDVHGLDLLRVVREQYTHHPLALMVITHAGGGYQMGQAIDAGADTFLIKPVGVDELLRGVSKLVEQVKPT